MEYSEAKLRDTTDLHSESGHLTCSQGLWYCGSSLYLKGFLLIDDLVFIYNIVTFKVNNKRF